MECIGKADEEEDEEEEFEEELFDVAKILAPIATPVPTVAVPSFANEDEKPISPPPPLPQ